MKKIAAVLWTILMVWGLAGPLKGSCKEPYFMPGTGIIPGMVSNLAGKYFVVLGVMDGSPADRSRIRVGDKLLSVNGTPAERLRGTDGLFKALNPPEGQKVEVRVERLARILDDGGEVHDFAFTSAPIKISPRTLPDLGMPQGRVLKPASPHAYGTNLRTDGPLRQGDHFFVFDGGYCVGTGRIHPEGGTFTVRVGGLPGSRERPDPEGKKLVFFRPVHQSTHAVNTVRDWPMDIPEPGPHPLFVKYDARKDLHRIAGEVLSHFKDKNQLLLEVVADASSSPVGGAPPPGGGMYVRTTIRTDMLSVRYDRGTDEIPRGAKGSIQTGDFVGIFYEEGDKADGVRAVLIHRLRGD